MVTVDGIHKEVIVGNPLKEDDAKLMIVVPKRTYFLLESLSEDDANFHSYVSVPGKLIVQCAVDADNIVYDIRLCRYSGSKRCLYGTYMLYRVIHNYGSKLKTQYLRK